MTEPGSIIQKPNYDVQVEEMSSMNKNCWMFFVKNCANEALPYEVYLAAMQQFLAKRAEEFKQASKSRFEV